MDKINKLDRLNIQTPLYTEESNVQRVRQQQQYNDYKKKYKGRYENIYNGSQEDTDSNFIYADNFNDFIEIKN